MIYYKTVRVGGLWCSQVASVLKHPYGRQGKASWHLADISPNTKMDQNGENIKLDWMYKGANSLVNREEYLLGKNIDKPLEQLNKEDKEKKLGIVQPKNHVEHECIPPSIRDFNKIVQAEQVDLSAKLQEDPLVAIKRQEEDARRQFLQNPVQLRKLQEALKAQDIQKKNKRHKKSKHSDSESDLDEQLRQKLMKLSGSTGANILKNKKRKSTEYLDTILMHKFNQLKEKLSQEDLNDILAGKISNSDDEPPRKIKKQKKHKDSCEDSDEEKKPLKNKSEGKDRKYKKPSDKKEIREFRRGSRDSEKKYKHKNEKDSSNSDSDAYQEKRTKYIEGPEKSYPKSRVPENSISQSEDDLDKMILQKLRSLRDSQPVKVTQEQEKTTEATYSYYDSDEDKVVCKKKAFGLVRPDGTKIPLNNIPKKSILESNKKDEPTKKPQIQKPRKLTEAEKDERRRQMMIDAVKHDAERSENLKKYRQQEKRQEGQKEFDKDFVHKQLARTANEASVESRLKSNLNNLQRSSQYMNSNFSRR